MKVYYVNNYQKKIHMSPEYTFPPIRYLILLTFWNVVYHIHLHVSDLWVILTTESLNRLPFLHVDTPDMVFLESHTTDTLIPVPVQPIRYLFEVPSIFLMEFTNK